jgi:hypothetical protein
VGVITPSLTRHLVIFFPARATSPERTDDDPLASDSTKKSRIGYVSSLLRRVVKFFSARAAPTEFDDPLSSDSTKKLLTGYVSSLLGLAVKSGALDDSERDEQFAKFKEARNARSNFAVYCGTFLGFRLRVIVILYSEYFALTYILDNAAPERESRPFSLQTIESVDELAVYLHGKLTIASNGKTLHKIAIPSTYDCTVTPNKEDYDSLNEIIYREVWNALDKALEHERYILSLGAAVFKTDLRGLSLTASSAKFEPDNDIYAQLQCTEPVATPAPKKPCITSYLKEQNPFFSATLCLGASPHLYAGEQPAAQWDPNHVLCFLSDGAAIYGSCLVYRDDPHDRTIDDLHQMKYNYTRFFIIYEGTNAYTLGRLIRRLHVLTELRVMALIERSYITSINDCLRSLGQELSSIIDLMTGRHSEPARKEPETLNINRLSRIIDAYNDIGRSRVATDTERGKSIMAGAKRIYYDRCYGGLSYRISRSKFYYKALMSRLEDLHCKDIKGAQSYERFVSRNYAQQMQAIESIGERYDILGGRIDRAITLSHNLLQRKFAQYALYVSLCVVAIAAFAAFNGMLNLIPDQDLGTTRWHISLSVLAFILLCVAALSIIFREFLQSRGLYVKIERTNRDDVS